MCGRLYERYCRFLKLSAWCKKGGFSFFFFSSQRRWLRKMNELLWFLIDEKNFLNEFTLTYINEKYWNLSCNMSRHVMYVDSKWHNFACFFFITKCFVIVFVWYKYCQLAITETEDWFVLKINRMDLKKSVFFLTSICFQVLVSSREGILNWEVAASQGASEGI